MIVAVGLARARAIGASEIATAGAIGLLAFVISVAAQITRLEAGRAPTAGVVGWPLVLIVVGAVGLIAPVLYRRKS